MQFAYGYPTQLLHWSRNITLHLLLLPCSPALPTTSPLLSRLSCRLDPARSRRQRASSDRFERIALRRNLRNKPSQFTALRDFYRILRCVFLRAKIAFKMCRRTSASRYLGAASERCLVRDALAIVAAKRRITCHRNEPTGEEGGIPR